VTHYVTSSMQDEQYMTNEHNKNRDCLIQNSYKLPKQSSASRPTSANCMTSLCDILALLHTAIHTYMQLSNVYYVTAKHSTRNCCSNIQITFYRVEFYSTHHIADTDT